MTDAAVNRRQFLGLLGAGAGVTLAGASGLGRLEPFAGNERRATASAHPQTLSIGAQGTFTSLNPLQNLGYQWTNLVSLSLYDPVLRLVSPGVIAPAAATAWDISDPNAIVLKIRNGMKFHDGSPVTVQDVEYSIAVRGEPSLVSEAKSTPLITSSQWKSIEVLPNGSIRINTNGRVNIASVFCSSGGALFVVPSNAHKLYNLATQEVGSGPFKLQSFVSGSSLSVTRNPDYWRGAPPLESIDFKLFSTLPAQVAALESGSIDAAYDVRPVDLPSLDHIANHTLLHDSTYWIEWFPQLQKPPLNDVRVRKALRYCLDVPALLSVAFPLGGRAVFDDLEVTPAAANIPVTQRYDPTYARKLLTDAGYDKLSIPLQTVPSAYEDAFLQAEVMQQGFQAAGIQCDIKTYETPDFISNVLLTGEWDGICFNAGTLVFPFVSLIVASVASLAIAGLSTNPAKMKKLNVTPQLIELCNLNNLGGTLSLDSPQLKTVYKQAQELEAQAAGLLVTFAGPSDWSIPNGLTGIERSGYGFDYLYKTSWT